MEKYPSDRRKHFIALAPTDNRSSFEQQILGPRTYRDSGPGGLRSHDNWLRRHVLFVQEQHPILTRRRALFALNNEVLYERTTKYLARCFPIANGMSAIRKDGPQLYFHHVCGNMYKRIAKAGTKSFCLELIQNLDYSCNIYIWTQLGQGSYNIIVQIPKKVFYSGTPIMKCVRETL